MVKRRVCGPPVRFLSEDEEGKLSLKIKGEEDCHLPYCRSRKKRKRGERCHPLKRRRAFNGGLKDLIGLFEPYKALRAPKDLINLLTPL